MFRLDPRYDDEDVPLQVPPKFTIKLPSGANYTVLKEAHAWGTEDLFGQQLRQKDRRRA